MFYLKLRLFTEKIAQKISGFKIRYCSCVGNLSIFDCFKDSHKTVDIMLFKASLLKYANTNANQFYAYLRDK